MKLMRVILGLATVVSAGVALNFLCIRPLTCHLKEPTLEVRSLELLAHQDDPGLQRKARAILEQTITCIRARPHAVNLYMIAALNSRLLEQDERAVSFYEQALKYDRRREIYLALGNTQSRLGRRDEAIENLLKANIYWPYAPTEIDDPVLRDEVDRRFTAYRLTLRARR